MSNGLKREGRRDRGTEEKDEGRKVRGSEGQRVRRSEGQKVGGSDGRK